MTYPNGLVTKSAILSECRTYRYVLFRHIPCALRWVRPALFVMLNPSVADAAIDDPTIRRCVGFATAWGCTSLNVVNLFALRATDPKELSKHRDPVGPENNRYIAEQIEQCRLGVIIVAWGAHDFAQKRALELSPLLQEHGAKCLGTTKDGAPRHPLYVKASQEPVLWTGK